MALTRRNATSRYGHLFPPLRGSVIRYLGQNRRSARASGIASRRFSRTRTGSRQRTTSGQGVTTQYDAKLIYRKRSMPRRRKRGWRRFSRKVHAVAEKSWGTLVFLFNNAATFTNNISGNQGLADFGLYGWTSTSSGFNDQAAMKAIIGAAAMTTTTGITVGNSSKVMFQSAILDLTLRNTSTLTTESGAALNSNAKLEIDIYECSMVKQAEDAASLFNNPRALFARNPQETFAIGGGATTEIALTLRGATPFEMNYCLSRFGVRIWKKTKYTLNNNEQMTYQMRDPKRRVTTLEEMGTTEGFNRPGWTKWLLIVFKIPPGLTVGTGVDTYQENITVGVTRKYGFKIPNYNEDRTAYIIA